MKQQINYGDLNPHIIGVLMREMVRRARLVITRERLSFQFKITGKTVDYKSGEDFLTSADTAAQEIYLSCIKEWFPDYGVIAEEDNLSILPKNGSGLYFTIDPLDGTKAFIRKQSQAISTMISLVHENDVIAVAIGDIMTGEIYYFRPESSSVHRIHDFFDKVETLSSISDDVELHTTYLLAREDIRSHSRVFQNMTHPDISDRQFKGIQIESGSIGTMFARLWKREVGGILLPAGPTTPWDANPVIGISEQLGYVWFTLKADNRLTPDKKSALKENTIQQETLIVHRSNKHLFFS